MGSRHGRVAVASLLVATTAGCSAGDGAEQEERAPTGEVTSSASPGPTASPTPTPAPAAADVPPADMDWTFSDHLSGGSAAEATAFSFERSQWAMRTTGQPDDGLAAFTSPEVAAAATEDALANEGMLFAGTYRVAALTVEETNPGRVVLCRDWTDTVVVADGEVYPFDRMDGVAPTDQVELSLTLTEDGQGWVVSGFEHQGPC